MYHPSWELRTTIMTCISMYHIRLESLLLPHRNREHQGSGYSSRDSRCTVSWHFRPSTS